MIATEFFFLVSTKLEWVFCTVYLQLFLYLGKDSLSPSQYKEDSNFRY